MKYTQVQQLRKQASESNATDIKNTEFSFNTAPVDNLLDDSLKKHYASLLAKAYKASTGETLKNPEQHIDPRYSYIIGRASNIRPEILAKLNDFYRERLSQVAAVSYNISPSLAMKAVEHANEAKGMYPLNYKELGLNPSARYTPGVKIKATVVDR